MAAYQNELSVWFQTKAKLKLEGTVTWQDATSERGPRFVVIGLNLVGEALMMLWVRRKLAGIVRTTLEHRRRVS